ncbi:ketoacyl-synt-domain-containing protein [Hypomontagnella monticulosa]|nr:ketoacyl-synt-domain-containing protein [Hypomontagnella monticulosa]
MDRPAPDAEEPIAVVGIGCRFPGGAVSPSALWQMLSAGESAWSEIPKSRLNVSSYFHPSGSRQGSIPFRAGHFLEEDVGAFDSSFFSIPADEARAIDPQQRILLEVSVEALDSAGIDRAAIKKSDTGVWVGSFVKDYEQIVLRDPDNSPKYGATGNGIAIMSNRISFFLDINGPSMTIDTGCSASLVCVHNACQSLRNREIDIGLAGGAGLILTPNTMMPMTALNFLSPDGKCYTFDARANGYGRGEGIGIVVMKRLRDAVRDNDNIRAVIRGSSVNQDGRTPGITLPSAEAQLRNIKSVYRRAGLSVNDTAYVECHGTGTQAGDWRELKAVSDAFCPPRSLDNPIYVGSVKTNIGHLEGCAGVAGLIKGILTVENGVIPKHLNFESPGNPDIDFDGWKVKVPVTNTPWPTSGMRRASINCFGFGGTNAHIIIDDAAHYLSQRGIMAHHNTTVDDIPSSSGSQPYGSDTANTNSSIHESARLVGRIKTPPRNSQTHLFVFSAHEQKVLSRVLGQYASHIGKGIETLPNNFMEDLAYTLGCRRTKMQWKASAVAQTPDELIAKLSKLQSGDFIRTSEDKSTKLAFVFGGQGAQWFAMGRELLGFDIFLQSIKEASQYLISHAGCTFNLLIELLKDEDSSRVNEPEISQPATTAIQVALVDLLMTYFGVSPSSVCGHSSGEIAAAYAVGALSQEDAWELAFHRGRCAGSLENNENPRGGMLAVGLSASEVQKYVDQVGNDRVVVACVNSPASVTLSGDENAIQELHEVLQTAGIFNRRLVIGIAYHSHHMKRCESEYLQSIAHIMPKKPSRRVAPHPHRRGELVTANNIQLETELADLPTSEVPVMYSSVTGHAISWQELGPEYWVKNMVSPVLFASAMNQMIKSKGDGKLSMIVELGPHSSLQSPIRQILDAENTKQQPSYCSVLIRGKDSVVTTLETVGKLWSCGCDISMPWVVMRNIQTRQPKVLVDLPKYPWNHENIYWHESHLSRANRFQVHGRYDLIGRPTADSIPFQPRWRGFFRVSENPWIQDHQVQKTVIYPASGMIAMVLEAAKQIASDREAEFEITQFKIQKAMIIPGTEHGLEYALNLSKKASPLAVSSARNAESPPLTTSITFECSIYSKQLDGPWEEHGSGFVTIHYQQSVGEVVGEAHSDREIHLQSDRYYEKYLDVKSTCDESVVPRQFYETLDVIGMNYGPLFQNISSLDKRDDACVSIVRIPDTSRVMPAGFEYPHVVHPATLDAVFQTAFALGSEPMVPSFLGSLYVSAESHMLSTAGEQLAVCTQAGRQGTRGASASFIVSDHSWLDTLGPKKPPLIIVKDLNFTALTPSPTSIENGFLPNHRNLCSEIIWESLDEPSSLGGAQQAIANNEQFGKSLDTLLVLIPVKASPGVSKICAELEKHLQCRFRTLDSIGKDEILPEFCISLLEADGHALVWSWAEHEFVAFQNLIAAVKGIFWVTRASQLEARNPQSSLIHALGRTIRSENPKKIFISFDVDVDVETDISDSSAVSLAHRIKDLVKQSFFGPKTAKPIETDYIERDGKVLVPRLVPVDLLNSMIEGGSVSSRPILQPMPAPDERPLKLEIGEVGDAESLYWGDDPEACLPVSPDDVKVRVLFAALSEFDNEVLHGRAQKVPLGTDVYGVVEEAGRNVSNVAIGDRVVGIVRGSLRDYVMCHHQLLYKLPDNNDDSQSHHPYLPTSFSVARYALRKLKAGDTILIHSGAGLFGQAAIQLAKAAGAIVFASAETNHQRGILHHFWNLPEDHVLDARGGSMDSILRLTGNRGVDVIYDPAARSRNVNVRCIKGGGRIIYFANQPDRNSSTMTRRNSIGKTYNCTMIDVADLIKHQAYRLGDALAFVCPRLRSGQFKVWHPDAHREFDSSDLAAAFSALSLNGAGAQICWRGSTSKPIPIAPRPPRPTSEYLSDNATYVLSGGLGGLGIEIAKLLATNGVKNIAFLSRSGETSKLAKICLNVLHGKGIKAQIFKVDVCDNEALLRASKEIRQSMPPVKGVFQCAAVLRDSVFENMTYEDWQLATRPKTLGSWNLHRVFGDNLDFFIFLSSSAGVIGNRGQANYAAGNTFQDSLARHMNTYSNGTMHAVSVDLGPVLGAGMLAEDPRTLDILKASGFFGIRLQDFKQIMESAIIGHRQDDQKMPAQVVTGVGTGGLTRQNKPADPYWTRTALFTHLNQVDMPVGLAMSGEDSVSQDVMRTLLAQASDEEEAKVIVSRGLREMLSKSMNMQAADVDESRPPSAYGVDSLVAVGVRNWVFRECEADVSIFEVLSETSIADLSATIVQRRDKA